MGQFKPMVKMMTTEPSIELKLKKGGKVENPNKKASSAGPTSVGARGGMAPVARPAAPSMAARRKAMAGMAKGGESKAAHAAEMKTMKDTSKKLEKHASMPASKAHKGLKTGGVVMGQGGFKKGGSVPASGIINTEGQGGAYRNTKMHTAQGEDHTPKKTGEVVMGKPGGYKKGGKAACYAKGGGVEGNVSTSKPGPTNTTTGEVKKGNAGGYKKGGAAKKAFATGGSVNDSGHPVAYPKKAASKPVSINRLSGTFKKGGDVKMAGGGALMDALRLLGGGLSPEQVDMSKYQAGSGNESGLMSAMGRAAASTPAADFGRYSMRDFVDQLPSDGSASAAPAQLMGAFGELASKYPGMADKMGGFRNPEFVDIGGMFGGSGSYAMKPQPMPESRFPDVGSLSYGELQQAGPGFQYVPRPIDLAAVGLRPEEVNPRPELVDRKGPMYIGPSSVSEEMRRPMVERLSGSMAANRLAEMLRPGQTFGRGLRRAKGGSVATEDLSRGAYDRSMGPSEEEMDMARAIRSMPRKMYEGAKRMMGMDEAPKAGSVTKTEKSVTVTPAKKRGGSVKR